MVLLRPRLYRAESRVKCERRSTSSRDHNKLFTLSTSSGMTREGQQLMTTIAQATYRRSTCAVVTQWLGSLARASDYPCKDLTIYTHLFTLLYLTFLCSTSLHFTVLYFVLLYFCLCYFTLLYLVLLYSILFYFFYT